MFLRYQTRGSTFMMPISSIVRAEGGKDGWRVVDTLGVTHTVSDFAWESAVENAPAGLIPAPPGTFLVWFNDEEGVDQKIFRQTVLGWQLGQDGEVLPVSLDPACQTDQPFYVEHPNGYVEGSQGNGVWNSPGDWLRAMLERKRQRTQAPQSDPSSSG